MFNIVVDGKAYGDFGEAAKVVGNGTATNDILNALVFAGTDPTEINGHTVYLEIA